MPSANMQVFRATNGKALVWGKPPQIISAKYITGDGKQKTSLLLASGTLSHLFQFPVAELVLPSEHTLAP